VSVASLKANRVVKAAPERGFFVVARLAFDEKQPAAFSKNNANGSGRSKKRAKFF
jgi:hypothetical protein